MNVEITNALSGYFETLYCLNQKLIRLCGINAVDDFENGEIYILEIIQNIPRLVALLVQQENQKIGIKKSRWFVRI